MKKPEIKQNGFINFPVNDKAYKNTQEGGLVVTLYVLDQKEFEDRWGLAFNDMEQWDMPKYFRFWKENYSMVWEGKEELTRILPTDEKRDILLMMHLASTNWSGWHKKEERIFAAEEEHLTPEGKVLFSLLEKLYPNCRLLMLTSIDT